MIPIREAVGLDIACPVCPAGNPAHAASVEHARGRVVSKVKVPQRQPDGTIRLVEYEAEKSEEIRTARLWYRVECPKGGVKLFKQDHPVEVIQ